MHQTYHANKKHRDKEMVKGTKRPLAVGDLVYLSTKNLNMLKGRARKIIPLFIGPFKIIRVSNASSTYTLELPRDLESRGLHSTFHASLLQCHEPNDDVLFPHCDTQAFYDLGDSEDNE